MTDESRTGALEGLPPSYADWRASTLGRITDAIEERLLIEQIGPVHGLKVLDVGCGDGVLAVKLAGTGADVTGLDVMPAMLGAAKERAMRAGVRLRLVEGRAEDLPFAAADFDLIVSVATLCFCKDPIGPIAEMVRCLRPGGRLVLGELARWSSWAAQRRVKGWLGSSTWRVAHFRSPRELTRLARGAGLESISITGAIYYPPLAIAARLMAPMDRLMGRITPTGAAFLVLSATKPALEQTASTGR